MVDLFKTYRSVSSEGLYEELLALSMALKQFLFCVFSVAVFITGAPAPAAVSTHPGGAG